MPLINIDKSLIPDSPLERISPEMKELLEQKMPFVDCHTHVFNHNDVPSGFIGIRLPIGRHFLGRTAKFFHGLLKHTDRDKMSKYAYFLTTMSERSSDAVFRRMEKYYTEHSDMMYVVLTMDMDPGIKGHPSRGIWAQLDIVAILRYKYPTKILPYVCIDPRRDDALDIFQDAFDKNKHLKYFGLKIYPSLGYLPSHPNLMKMYAVCEEKNIPVLTHCSSGSTHGSDRILDNVEGTFVNDKGIHIEGPHRFKAKRFKKKRDYRNFFNRPENWEPVLKKYKNLNLNIAHFAGDEAWEGFCSGKDPKWVNNVLKLIDTYDHVYSDFSYTLFSRTYSLKLKELMENDSKLASRVLFGSDYYMLVIQNDYAEIFKNFKAIMEPELMNKLAKENPRKHLFGLDTL